MADEQVRFSVTVEDDVSGAAGTAASSLETLASQVRADTAALGVMQKALRSLRSSTTVSADAVQDLKDRIAVQKIVIGNAQAKMLELGGAEALVTAHTQRAGSASATAAKQQTDLAAASRAAKEAAAAAAANQADLAAKSSAANVASGKASAAQQLQNATLERAQSALQATTEQVRNLQSALSNVGDDSPFADKLRAQLERTKGAMAAAQERVVELGGAGRRTGVELRGLSTAASAMPGPLGTAASRFGSLTTAASGAALGIAAAAAAVLAFTAALAYATSKLARYGFTVSGAVREEKLHLEALRAMSPLQYWAGRSAGSMQRSIDRVAESSALARGEIVKYHEQLYRAGLRGKNLETALEGVSVTAAATGEQGAQWFIRQARYARAYGKSLEDLTDRYKKRFGEIADAKALSLPRQLDKLRESFARLFGGLKITPFLRAVQSLFKEFKETAAIGKAIKTVFESLFQPLVDGATNSVPLVKRFLQGLIITGLQIGIAFLKVKNSLRDAFEGTPLDKIDKAKIALNLGKVAAVALAIALGGVTVALGALTLALGTAAVVLLSFWASLLAPWVLIGGAIYLAIKAVKALWDWFAEKDWGALASSLVDGLVNGIKKASSGFVDAIKSMGIKGLKAFKSLFGIASPSKVMYKESLQLGQGSVNGLRAMRTKVQKAFEYMAPDTSGFDVGVVPRLRTTGALGDASFSTGSGSGSIGVSGSRVTVRVEQINVHTQAQSISEAVPDIRRAVVGMLRDAVAEAGA